ncbi:MAG: hypothetical protein ACREUQ_11835, partial [Burkholderiales bacterium]
MSFWAYVFHCCQMPCYARGKLPVEPVWLQDFPSRIEALEARCQIKGWARQEACSDSGNYGDGTRNRSTQTDPSAVSQSTCKSGKLSVIVRQIVPRST